MCGCGRHPSIIFIFIVNSLLGEFDRNLFLFFHSLEEEEEEGDHALLTKEAENNGQGEREIERAIEGRNPHQLNYFHPQFLSSRQVFGESSRLDRTEECRGDEDYCWLFPGVPLIIF